MLLVEDDEEDYEFTKELFAELDVPRHELFLACDYQASMTSPSYPRRRAIKHPTCSILPLLFTYTVFF